MATVRRQPGAASPASTPPSHAPPADVSLDPKGDRSQDVVQAPPDVLEPLLPPEREDTRDTDRGEHERARTPADRRRP